MAEVKGRWLGETGSETSGPSPDLREFVGMMIRENCGFHHMKGERAA